ncbi:hypothetical protein Tco_0149673 [Tanacetum coccineum]
MANLSSCDSDVLSEVPYSDTSQNDMMNQSVQELQYSELSPIVDYPDNEITSDSNIIPYSQYLEEMQQAILERYKERVKILEQRFNVDLSGREKFIDSQMDDMIRMKKNQDLLQFETEIEYLKPELSKHSKKRTLLATLMFLKTAFKKENQTLFTKEIVLKNKNKELETLSCSILSYTFISSDSNPSAWGIPLMGAGEVPEMDPYEEVAQQGQAAPLSPAYVPDPMELEHHVSVYVPEPVEDPINYVADADDDEEEEEESFEDDDDEEEEHLAPADSTAIASPTVDHVPSAEKTEPFETDESAATPPPPTYRTTSRMSVRSQAPIPFPSEAEIPSPPLLVPSPPTTSLTYAEAPLGYKAARIRLRAASPLPSPTSPPTHHLLPLPAPPTSRRANIPEADIPPQKRLLLIAPTPRFEFVDTVDASIRASERRTMAAIEMVNLRRDHATLRDEVDTLRRYLSSLCTTHEQERVEARQDLDRSEAHNKALEARIVVLETQAYRYEWQRQDADDHATGAMMHIQALEARARIDTL